MNAAGSGSLRDARRDDRRGHRPHARREPPRRVERRRARPSPPMRQAKFGRIVNIASTAAVRGYRFNALYTASKHALAGLTRSLSAELLPDGITVNAVCPGFTDTDIVERRRADDRREDRPHRGRGGRGARLAEPARPADRPRRGRGRGPLARRRRRRRGLRPVDRHRRRDGAGLTHGADRRPHDRRATAASSRSRCRGRSA